MTRSSKTDWASAATSLRANCAACNDGGEQAFDHFRDLVSELFCLTVGHKQAGVWMSRPASGGPIRRTLLGGHGSEPSLIKLNNGGYLRFTMGLYLKPDGEDKYLRSSISSYQYQLDENGEDWVFRYEYRRDRHKSDRRPMGHLHIRGDLHADCLNSKKTLERVHFACGRPTIEGLIAVLADEFHIDTNAPDEVWRPALRETEAAFLSHAHPALS